MSSETHRVRIEFVKSPAFRNVFSTGAHGGVGPQGDIYFVLTTDRVRMPEAEEMVMDQDGQVEEIHPVLSSQAQIIREELIGVHMTAATAESLATWLMQKVEEHKRKSPLPNSH